MAWEPTVRLQSHECEAIISALAVDGSHADRAISAVQRALGTYYTLREDQASKWEIKRALTALAAKPDTEILEAVDALDEPAREILELLYCDLASRAQLVFVLDMFSRLGHGRRRISRGGIATLRRAAESYQPKGRRSTEPEGILVNLLAHIWWDFHPGRTLRNVDRDSHKEVGGFRDFVNTCFRAARIGASTTRPIRRVYDGWLKTRCKPVKMSESVPRAPRSAARHHLTIALREKTGWRGRLLST